MTVNNQSKIENKCIHSKDSKRFQYFLAAPKADLHNCENKFIDIQEYFIDNSGVLQNTFLLSCQKLYILGNCVLSRSNFTISHLQSL